MNDVVETQTQESAPVATRRSPIGAVLLTLAMTGLGHVYCGELVIGLAWAAGGTFAGTLSLWGMATQTFGFGFGFLLISIMSLVAVVHVWSLARHAPDDYRLKSYNHWKVYLLLGLMGTFGAAGYAVGIRSHVLIAFATPSRDMAPTIQKGDRFLVDKMAYHNESPLIGEVVVFKNPEKPSQAYIKRVVAVGEEKVEIRDGQLLINDKPRDFPQAMMGNDVEDFGPVVVAPHNYFVLGDSRANSKDSRQFGTFAGGSLIGKATRIYWPPAAWFDRSEIE